MLKFISALFIFIFFSPSICFAQSNEEIVSTLKKSYECIPNSKELERKVCKDLSGNLAPASVYSAENFFLPLGPLLDSMGLICDWDYPLTADAFSFASPSSYGLNCQSPLKDINKKNQKIQITLSWNQVNSPFVDVLKSLGRKLGESMGAGIPTYLYKGNKNTNYINSIFSGNFTFTVDKKTYPGLYVIFTPPALKSRAVTVFLVGTGEDISLDDLELKMKEILQKVKS